MAMNRSSVSGPVFTQRGPIRLVRGLAAAASLLEEAAEPNIVTYLPAAQSSAGLTIDLSSSDETDSRDLSHALDQAARGLRPGTQVTVRSEGPATATPEQVLAAADEHGFGVIAIDRGAGGGFSVRLSTPAPAAVRSAGGAAGSQEVGPLERTAARTLERRRVRNEIRPLMRANDVRRVTVRELAHDIARRHNPTAYPDRSRPAIERQVDEWIRHYVSRQPDMSVRGRSIRRAASRPAVPERGLPAWAGILGQVFEASGRTELSVSTIVGALRAADQRFAKVNRWGIESIAERARGLALTGNVVRSEADTQRTEEATTPAESDDSGPSGGRNGSAYSSLAPGLALPFVMGHVSPIAAEAAQMSAFAVATAGSLYVGYRLVKGLLAPRRSQPAAAPAGDQKAHPAIREWRQLTASAALALALAAAGTALSAALGRARVRALAPTQQEIIVQVGETPVDERTSTVNIRGPPLPVARQKNVAASATGRPAATTNGNPIFQPEIASRPTRLATFGPSLLSLPLGWELTGKTPLAQLAANIDPAQAQQAFGLLIGSGVVWTAGRLARARDWSTARLINLGSGVLGGLGLAWLDFGGDGVLPGDVGGSLVTGVIGAGVLDLWLALNKSGKTTGSDLLATFLAGGGTVLGGVIGYGSAADAAASVEGGIYGLAAGVVAAALADVVVSSDSDTKASALIALAGGATVVAMLERGAGAVQPVASITATDAGSSVFPLLVLAGSGAIATYGLVKARRAAATTSPPRGRRALAAGAVLALAMAAGGGTALSVGAGTAEAGVPARAPVLREAVIQLSDSRLRTDDGHVQIRGPPFEFELVPPVRTPPRSNRATPSGRPRRTASSSRRRPRQSLKAAPPPRSTTTRRSSPRSRGASKRTPA